ncbi:pyridoxine biosynthesis protein [Coemansia sp. RSA 2131]|nr:pyridoxine biosynthesis protein [Coemansia sp. RSA 2131]
MPALSPTMTEGGIARWEKQEGEAFAAGDLLLQIETDKAQMDVEAQDDGVLVKILAPEGAQNVPVNSVIAIVAEEGEDIASIDIGALSKQPEAEAVAEKVEKVEKKAEKAEKKIEKTEKKPSSGLTSPAAEFTIHANHIANAVEIEGTGPKGRVLKGDVLQFLKSGKAVISKPEISPVVSKPAASKPVAKAASSGNELPFLVQSLEPSVLRHLAQVELAKRSVVVQVPAARLVQLVKANRGMTVDALAVRAIALALQQVQVEGNGVGVVTDGSKVAEVAGAATASVLDLVSAIKQARSGSASGRPAAVLAGENVFTPDTLPEATVVVVGAPYASVSAAEASAAMDSALNDLLGMATSSARPSQQASSTVIDVRVISNSPTVASALASKIKGFLSNPELLTF